VDQRVLPALRDEYPECLVRATVGRAAIVIDVEGEEHEDLMTRGNPKFWEMIEEIRKQPTISLEEAKRYFQEADEFEAKHGRPMTPAAAKKVVSGERKAGPTRRAPARRRTED
jgi:hypothetical protein